jgi:hypothetical protein
MKERKSLARAHKSEIQRTNYREFGSTYAGKRPFRVSLQTRMRGEHKSAVYIS